MRSASLLTYCFTAFAMLVSACGGGSTPAGVNQPATIQLTNLTDTGASNCVDETAITFTPNCTGTRQDADSGRDGPAGFSYTKVCNSGQNAGTGTCPSSPSLGPGNDQWGCVLDNVTKLTWELKTTDGGNRDAGNSFSGAAITKYAADVNSIGLCGIADWRVPTMIELQSLANYGISKDYSYNADWFPNSFPNPNTFGTFPGYYSLEGYVMDFSAGYIQVSSPVQLRLVHGNSSVGQRYSYSTDGSEVTDLQYRLTWKRCPEGQGWSGSTCTGTPSYVTWPAALQLARTASSGGSASWRLPDIKEATTLAFPTFDTNAFPQDKTGQIWTSTPQIVSAQFPYVVSTSGSATPITTTYVFANNIGVRLVRTQSK